MHSTGMDISVDKLTKAFALYYLHRVLPDDEFVKYLKCMTNVKEMSMAIQVFNGKSYRCDRILEHILDSQIFKDMCKKIDFANKLVLNHLKNASLPDILRKFQEAVEMNSNVNLETLVDSCFLFSTSNKKELEESHDVVDLTFDESSDTSSSSSSSSSPEPPLCKESSVFSSSCITEEENIHSSGDMGGKRSFDISELSVDTVQSAKKIRTNDNDNGDTCEEEEGLIPLNLKKYIKKQISEINDEKSIQPMKEKGTTSKRRFCPKKWTINDDQVFISFVHSDKDNIFKNLRSRKKLLDFVQYEELFQRSASSLYCRWRWYIYPFLVLYDAKSDILCWRLKFFKILKEKNYTSLIDVPWFLMTELLPIDNLQTYKALFDSYKIRSRKTCFKKIIAYAITKLTEKLYYIEKLKMYHESFLKGNNGSQCSKPSSSSVYTSAENISTSYQANQIPSLCKKNNSVKKNLTCSPRVNTTKVGQNPILTSTSDPHQSQEAPQLSDDLVIMNDSSFATSTLDLTLLPQAKDNNSFEQESNEKIESHLIPNTLRRSAENDAGITSFNKSRDRECEWSLNHDLELLHAILKINPLHSELSDKLIFSCYVIRCLQVQFSMDFELLKNRWVNVLLPALKTKYVNEHWELSLIHHLILFNFSDYIDIEWKRIRIQGKSTPELQNYILYYSRKEKKDLKRLIRARLLSILEQLPRNPDSSEKIIENVSTEGNNKIDVLNQEPITLVRPLDDNNAPFQFSESRAIVDHVFLFHPNLDLQTSQMKSSFFLDLLPSRSLHSVHMHWEKLVCVYLFSQRIYNWKMSFLEYISNWQFSSFNIVFSDAKVAKLYTYIPEDARKRFIKTCILFSDANTVLSSFLMKIKFCYEYLRIKKEDLSKYDAFLEYSIPLFSPHQKTKEKTWDSDYKPRSNFTYSERLELLKKVITAYPDKDASLVSPSNCFFTRIAPHFDRTYVSLKDQWHRSIRLMLLLFKYNKLNDNWEYDVLSHFVQRKMHSRQAIDWPNTLSQFPYLTTNSISSVVASAMKKKESGSFLEKLENAMENVKVKNRYIENEPWKYIIDYYRNYEEGRKERNSESI